MSPRWNADLAPAGTPWSLPCWTRRAASPHSRRSPAATLSKRGICRSRRWSLAYHELLADADSIDAMPVVVADLHSALAPILLAIEYDRPGTRVVYVMSDQGALPLAFSRSVADLRAGGLLAGTVTVGQAFGGDLEAVTLHSGLLAARLALDADVVVVTQGPGNLGTGTRWDFLV